MSKKKTDSDSEFLSTQALAKFLLRFVVFLGILTPILVTVFNFNRGLITGYMTLIIIIGASIIFLGEGNLKIRIYFPLFTKKAANLRVKKAPGSTLLSIVDFLFSSTTVENVFKPIIADWRVEYFDALNKGRHWKAQWIRVRYLFSFLMAMGLSKVLSVIRSVAHK